MADSTNNIDIVIQDKVDAGIAPKLVSIRDAAKDAAPAVGALAAELDRLKSMGAIGALMDSVGRSTASLASSAGALATQERASTNALAAGATALKTKTQVAREAALAQKALADAARYTVGAMNEEVAMFKLATEAHELNNQANSQTIVLMADEAAAFYAVTEAMTGLSAGIDSAIAEQVAYNQAQQTLMEQSGVITGLMDEEVAAFLAVNEAMAGLSVGIDNAIASRQAEIASTEAYIASMADVAQVDIYDIALKDGLALAANNAATADERMAETNAMVASVMTDATAVTAARTASTNNLTFALLGEANAEREVSAATGGQVSANVSAAASLGILEGRTLSMNRAAANFLTKILPFGEILQAAFPVIGLVALISVAYQAYTAFEKLQTKIAQFPTVISLAFQKATDSIINTNIETQGEIDKMQGQIDKLEHRPTENGMVIAFDEARDSAAKLGVELDKETEKFDTLLKKSNQTFFQKLLGDSGTDPISKTLGGYNDRIKAIKEEAEQTFQDISSRTDQSPADKTRNIAEVREGEMVALEKVYSDADGYITPLLQKLRGQMDDFNDPLRKATGTAGSDPSGQIALLKGASAYFDADQQSVGEGFLKDTTKTKLDGLKTQLGEQRDAVKEAAKEWKALEAAFVSYQSKISESGKKPTAQQDLTFLRGYDDKINPLNATKLQQKELPFQNAVDSQNYGQDQITKLTEQASRLNEYGAAVKESTELDRIMQESQKKGISLDADQVAQLALLSEAIRVGTPLQEAKSNLLKEATASEDKYALTLKASQVVMADHPELTAAITTELNKLKIAHADTIDPMNEFNRGISQEIALMGQYGTQLEVSQKVQALANELRAKGVTDYQAWAEAQREVIALTVQSEQLQQAENAIYESTVGAVEKLTTARMALVAATRQELSAEAQRSALVKNSSELNDQQLKTQGTGGNVGSVFTGAISSYASNFTTVAAGLKTTLQGTFSTLADGFADSIGRAIVYAKNLGQALKDVARSALSELISGLIKLGIQMAVVALAKKLFTNDSTVTNTAQATTTAAAWAPAAALVSLATFGANQAPAMEALGVTTALAEGLSALSSVGGHAGGGWIDGIGSGTSDSNLRWLSDGEYVVRASAAAQNAGLLEAINDGKQVQGSGSSGPYLVSGGGSKPMSVQVHNYAGVAITTQQLDESTVRIIARDEADKSVHANADTATANAVANPNSKTAKAMRNYTTAARRRAS